ncbi:MAG: hypothetical protein ABL901_20355 [Hyphomicrobiaceae bacterium]
MVQVTSKTVKAAALLMAVPALLLPMKTAAQQMALGGPEYSKCDQIKDPAASAQCYSDANIANSKTRIAVAGQRIQVAERDGQCARDLKALRESDPTVLDRGRAILAGRPAAQFGVCNLLDALRR